MATKGRAKIKIGEHETETELEDAKIKILELKGQLKLEEAISEFRERLIRIEDKMDAHNKFDARIRTLEIFKWKAVGVISVVGIAVAIAIKYL